MGEYGEAIDDLFGEDNLASQSATQQAVAGVDADPDSAARAIQLSKRTGVAAPIIDGDIDYFEKNHKAQLVGQMLRESPALQDYVNRYPLGAKVSNDDWPALNEVHQKVSKSIFSGLDLAVKTAAESFNADPIGVNRESVEQLATYLGVTPGVLDAVKNSPPGQAAMTNLAITDGFMRLLTAGVHGAARTGGQLAGEFTGLDPDRVEREIGSLLEWAMNRGDINLAHGMGTPKATPRVVKDVVNQAAPYVAAGEVPPPGVNMWMDYILAMQAKEETKGLMDSLKEVNKSATRERSPEAMEAFLNPVTQGRTIGVSSDAMRELYGSKTPLADDGLFGYVPDLAQQLKLAEHSGADIEIPLDKFLAHTDPAVAKELEPFLRVRKEGMTVAEAELAEAKPMPDVMGRPEPRTIEEIARREAQLEPLAQVGRADVQLERFESIPGSDAFYIKSEGKTVGTVNATMEENGRLYIDYVQGFDGPGSLGLHSIRAFLDALKREYPEAKTIAGHRVSGAREGTKSEGAFVEVSVNATPQEFAQHIAEVKGWDKIEADAPREVPEGTVRTKIGNAEVEYRPFEIRPEAEQAVIKKIDEILKQVAPGLKWAPFDRIEMQGAGMEAPGAVRGVYKPGNRVADAYMLVALAQNEKVPIGTAMHEVIHHLRSGFFTTDEWKALEGAAQRGGWEDKHGIKNRYPTAPEWLRLEESIAEEYKLWVDENLLSSKEMPPEAVKAFQKIKELFQKIMQAIRDAYGEHVSFDEIFTKVSAGEVGSRKPTGIGGARFTTLADAFAQATAAEEAQMFAKGAAIGMTEVQFKRYMALMEKQREETQARAERRAERAKEVTHTQQWKENAPAVRQEVTDQVNSRPDVMADDFFRRGLINGEKVKRVKIGEDFIPDKDKMQFKDIMSPDGINPSQVAGMFGYVSGESMIQALAKIKAEREELGIGPTAQKNRMINAQFEATMMKRYGVADHDALLKEAREDIVTETAMDMLAEETMALAAKSGQTPPLEKGQLKTWVKQEFNNSGLGNVKSMEKFIREAGRAGRLAEDALLKGDYIEAFRKRQQQYISMLLAKEAKDLGKEIEKFEKLADKYTKREVKGVDQQFQDFIQDLMVKAGFPVRRSGRELQEAIARTPYKTLDDFVNSKNGDGWEITMPDYLQAGQVPKYGDEMTVDQFRGMRDAIDSLHHVGREVDQIEVGGAKRDFEEFKKEVLDNIRSLPKRDINKPMRVGFRADAEMVRMEEIVKDLDLRQELGPLYNAMIDPMMNSKHTEYSMTEKLSKDLTAVKGDFGRKWRKTLEDDIPQDFLIDPDSKLPYDMTREHMINIMFNFGNRSNIEKFTRGYAGKERAPLLEKQLWDLFDRHANKEDWDYVQRIWDLFKQWEKPAGEMYYDLSGVAPKWIDPTPLTTKHGNYDGGYFPIIYDRQRSGMNVVEEGRLSTNAMFGGDYFRSTTANGYAKERTGYVDYISFENTIEQAGARMQQMIHDIAYRRAVINVDKVIRDREIRHAIRRHYGEEYEKQLNPWLKDIANHFNQSEQAVSFWNSFSRRVRYNLIASALGLNLKVILSPGMGLFNPKEATSILANWSESKTEALSKSKELPHTFKNMDRDFREKLEQTITKGGWSAFQGDAFRWAFAPILFVEQKFRTMTFLSEYRKGIEKGLNEGEAISIADSYVRERHGAGGLPDLPAIMRSNEAMKMSTMFYGYFNTMYNWQRQIPGGVKRGEVKNPMAAFYGSVLLPAAFGALFFNKAEPDDSWFKRIAKAMALQPLQTLVFGRDIANYFIEGQRPGTPWISMLNAISGAVTEGKRKMAGKSMEKPIQRGANVVGLTVGIPGAGQLGRSGQFVQDVSRGKQRPKNILDWMRGLTFGELPKKKGH